MFQFKEGTRIENPRDYNEKAVLHLRELLEAGRAPQVDRRRPNFYELDGEQETYYFHVSPVTGAVLLLARWVHQPQAACCA